MRKVDGFMDQQKKPPKKPPRETALDTRARGACTILVRAICATKRADIESRFYRPDVCQRPLGVTCATAILTEYMRADESQYEKAQIQLFLARLLAGVNSEKG